VIVINIDGYEVDSKRCGAAWRFPIRVSTSPANNVCKNRDDIDILHGASHQAGSQHRTVDW
jgi:hypothetical protein